MPSDGAIHPNASWKLGKTRAKAEDVAMDSPAWRRELATRLRRPRRWLKNTKIALGILFFLLLLCLLVWTSTWIHPPDAFALVLIGAGYEDNLTVPHNVYGWASLTALTELGDAKSGDPTWDPALVKVSGPGQLRNLTEWDAPLGQVGERTLVLFVTAQGIYDGQASALLLEDAQTQEPGSNQLPLVKLIERLGQLDPAMRKILILDPGRIEADWQRGVLCNDFARGLYDLEAKISSIANLVVISACDAWQRSWVSEDRRRTIFGHFVLEGLKGAADEGQDGRVDGWELFQYVQRNVEHWAWTNRESLQRPIVLPAGPSGRQRAQSIELTVVRESSSPSAPAAVVPFELPAALKTAWARYQQISKQVPSPAVYAPHEWRQYRRVLRRYEQLLLAGAREAGLRQLERLSQLELSIGQSTQLRLASIENNLAMPAVAGIMDTNNGEVAKRFNELWSAKPPDRGKVWGSIRSLLAGGDPHQVRLTLYRLLLERLAEAPAENLAEAYDIAQLIEDPVYPRPVESHYLIMLHRDLPAGPWPSQFTELFRQSLQLRVLAEKSALIGDPSTYPYCEQVNLWSRALVESADQQRQFGQDLLLTANQKDWEQAWAKMQKAQTSYGQARERAQLAQRALGACNRVLAELPGYSAWLAQRPPSQASRATTAAKLLPAVEQIWQQTDRLIQLVEPAQFMAGPHSSASALSDQTLRDVATLTQAVEQSFQELQLRYVDLCEEITRVNLPGAWRDAEAALLVMHSDPDLRQQLVAHQRQMSEKILEETAEKAVEAPAVTDQEHCERAKERGERQGRVALAMLGQRWFDACRVAEPESYAETQRRLATFAVDQNWEQSLNRAGKQIGLRWQQMAGEIDRLIKSYLTGEPDTDPGALQSADRLVRRLPATASLSISSNPVGLFRQRLVQDLLLWQAERTLQEHWFSEEPSDKPYYEIAGRTYTDDARNLVVTPRLLPPVSALEKRLAQPGKLQISGPQRLHLTSEQQLVATYQLDAGTNSTVPAGFPVLWMKTGPDLGLLTPNENTRYARQIEPGRSSDSVTCTVASPLVEQSETKPAPAPTTHETSLTVSGLFRGQKIELSTSILIDPDPEVLTRQHRADSLASVTVKADAGLPANLGASGASIALILDCSGSMGPPDNGTFDDRTKYAQAVGALQQVLKTLQRGTIVSLWVFGQAMGPAKTVTQAESTIQQIQSPIVWDPTDPLQLESLIAKVQYPALEPWNESPIVRTILYAAEDLKGGFGVKKLLVITDGMDNRFAQDAELNPDKKDIPVFLLETFGRSDIQIDVVGFQVVSEEEKEAQRQFEVVAKLPVPGAWYSVSNSDELTAVLKASVKPILRYRVETDDNLLVAGVPQEGLQVGAVGASSQWLTSGLAPGGYKLRLTGSPNVVKSLVLNRGELLIAKLTAKGDRLQFERGIYSSEELPWKPHVEEGGWRAALLQNQLLGDGAAQMMVTLEKAVSPAETTLQLFRPRHLWLEVAPSGETSARYTQLWSQLEGYPAPTWGLQVPRWPSTGTPPGPSVPVARLWWSPDRDPPPVATLQRGHDFKTYRDLARRSIRVGDNDITIDSIRVERHRVQLRAGVQEVKPCLVVRLVHSADSPVWVQLSGLSPAGQEHRFYRAASRYTGIFWPIADDEADGLDALSVYSLTLFKNEAKERGFYLEMRDLKAPISNDLRPKKPIELK